MLDVLFLIGKQQSRNFYEMQEKVHLEDFFWTGSGDEPPDYLKHVNTGISKERDVIVKTETVIATVYVDGKNVRKFAAIEQH